MMFLRVLTTALLTTLTRAQTLLDVVVDSEVHSILEEAVLAATPLVANTLNSPNVSLTLFAPDDDAFDVVPQNYLRLLTDREPWVLHLNCLLLGHVHGGGAILAGDLAPTQTINSLNNNYDLTIVADNGTVTINDSASVTTPDLNATNGVVHSIDGVLLPDCVSMTILDRLQAAGTYSTLIALVSRFPNSDMLDFVTTTDPGNNGLTLFAPTDAAFAKLPDYIVQGLTNDTMLEDVLEGILEYHFVEENAFFVMSMTLESVYGEDIEVVVDGQSVSIGNTTVNRDPVYALNGLIYEIDSVLVPEDLVPDLPQPPTEAPTDMPTAMPTAEPVPTATPTTGMPTNATTAPTASPTVMPTVSPNVTTDMPVPAPTSGAASTTGSVAVAILALVGSFVF